MNPSSSWSTARCAALILAASLTVLILGAGFWLFTYPSHRRPPRPTGMVFRAEIREVVSPLDRITVEPSAAGRSAIIVREPATREHPARAVEYEYPSGKVLGPVAPADPVPATTFDFDGDGVNDTIQTGIEGIGEGRYGLIEVVSGARPEVLFSHDDPLEYESNNRAFPLGDLDGDGCSELALLHPRMDRSRYDFELGDALFGAHSWITVVSGTRSGLPDAP